MHATSPVPSVGGVFLDARGDDRTLRVSWHSEAATVVLSLWRGGTCAGTFRLAVQDVPGLVESLRAGLGEAYDEHHHRLGEEPGEQLVGSGRHRAVPEPEGHRTDLAG